MRSTCARCATRRGGGTTPEGPTRGDAIALRAWRAARGGGDAAGGADAEKGVSSAPAGRGGGVAKREPAQPPRVWIDLRIPADAPPGEYTASLDLMQATFKQPL